MIVLTLENATEMECLDEEYYFLRPVDVMAAKA
jgi:hypothetical protein